MLFSVGFLIFVRSNLDLFTDASSSPCVIYDSRERERERERERDRQTERESERARERERVRERE